MLHHIQFAQQAKYRRKLKSYLQDVGYRALNENNWPRVDIVSLLLKAGGLVHE